MRIILSILTATVVGYISKFVFNETPTLTEFLILVYVNAIFFKKDKKVPRDDSFKNLEKFQRGRKNG